MAKFEKGRSGNPGGRPKLSKEIRTYRETSYEEFLKKLQEYGNMTKDSLRLELTRPDATMWELTFGNMVASMANGDRDVRREIMDRLWGKAEYKGSTLDAEATDNSSPQIILTLPDNGRSNKDIL